MSRRGFNRVGLASKLLKLARAWEAEQENGAQAEVRSQKSDVRCQMSDVRCQMSEDRSQMSDGGRQSKRMARRRRWRLVVPAVTDRLTDSLTD